MSVRIEERKALLSLFEGCTMDLTRLQELKRKLLQEAQLPPVWGYFLDHFGDKQEFRVLGDRVNHPFVEAVVTEVGKQLFGPKKSVRDLILKRIDDANFIHGGFMIDGHIGGVIYFEDEQMGLVMVAEMPPSIEVKYARFSGQQVRRKIPEPSQN
jgi:hypothetical protein